MSLIKVPLELKPNYLRDPENFLRDVACISTASTRPFFKMKKKIIEVEDIGLANPFDDKSRTFDKDFKRKDGDLHNRYMHIDLGLTKDAVGISMCYAPYFVDRENSIIMGEGKVEIVRLPFIRFDFIGRIRAGKGEEILLSSIRELIYDLTNRGFYLALITFDGFQSVDSIQILKSQGYKVARQSIDRSSTKLVIDKRAKDNSGLRRVSTDGQVLGPMQCIKDALYDNRLKFPYHPYWKIEAEGAEMDYKKNKVDHKPRGSIDVLQSMAGSTYGLTNNEFEYLESEESLGDQGDSFYDSMPNTDDSYLYPDYKQEEVW